MARRVLAALAMLSAVAFPAGAAEFVPGWKSDGVWDSNVLRTSQDNQSDFSFRNGPTLRLREREGDLTYDVNYRLTYEAFTRLRGINGFDQYFNGRGAWNATATTRFSFTDDFAYTSNLNAIFETVGVNQLAIASLNRQQITVNTAHAGVTHRLGPLWQLSLLGDNQFYDYRDPLQSDSLSTTGTAQLTRGVTPRLVVGGGARFQRQEFADVGDTTGSGTTFYQGFGVLEYSVSPTLSITAQAGPAWAAPDQPQTVTTTKVPSYRIVDPATCVVQRAGGIGVFEPTANNRLGGCQPSRYSRTVNGTVEFLNPNLPPDTSDVIPSTMLVDVPFTGDQKAAGSLTYFGRLSIDKTWNLWRGSLSFNRSASSGSGLGTSTTLNSLEGSVEWTPTRLWLLNLSASYSIQSALSQQSGPAFALTPLLGQAGFGNYTAQLGAPVDVGQGPKLNNAFDVSSYLVQFNADRRISRRLTLDASASWYQQSTSGALVVASSQSIYRVSVGFTWNFDPIPL